MRYWNELTSEEIATFTKDEHTLILPIGSVEQHGKHLTVSYDYKIAKRLARDIGLRISSSKKLLKHGIKRYYPSGVVGDPSRSSSELGEEFYGLLLGLYLGDLGL